DVGPRLAQLLREIHRGLQPHHLAERREGVLDGIDRLRVVPLGKLVVDATLRSRRLIGGPTRRLFLACGLFVARVERHRLGLWLQVVRESDSRHPVLACVVVHGRARAMPVNKMLELAGVYRSRFCSAMTFITRLSQNSRNAKIVRESRELGPPDRRNPRRFFLPRAAPNRTGVRDGDRLRSASANDFLMLTQPVTANRTEVRDASRR